jgi:hypothetical protein
MHDCKPHSYIVHSVHGTRYPLVMQQRQRIIVEWMRDVMNRRRISAARWAELARERDPSCTLHGPTITRAMKDSYPFVTKATTIAMLAAAVGESPPDVGGDTGEGETIPLPSPDSLRAMIDAHLRAVSGGAAPSTDLLEDLSRRVHESLSSLQGDPDAARVPEAARSAALQISRQFDREERVEDGVEKPLQ